MKIRLIRYHIDALCTRGLMSIDGEFVCFTLEDPVRPAKIAKLSAIPAGTYQIGFNQVDTPMTLSYRARYPFFEWHLHVKGVPGFEGVYIHVGNTPEHTDGCILVGNSAEAAKPSIGSSAVAYQRAYRMICSALKAGQSVTITIENPKP